MVSSLSLNNKTEEQNLLEAVESKKVCCSNKTRKTVGSIIGLALSIIFVVLGALNLAGAASFPLLIIGGVGLGIISLGWIISIVAAIVFVTCLNRNEFI